MEKKASLWNKFTAFIHKDTTVANESIKVTVVIRILLLSVLVYFIANLILSWNVLDARGRVLCVSFAVVIAVLFYMSYSLRARVLTVIFSLGLLGFIWFNLVWFGWWIGVQHFLMVILLLTFFVGYEGYPVKMLLAAGLCLLRIIFYYRFHEAEPVYAIPSQMGNLLQIINTVTIFWCLSVIGYIFSKSTRQMEGKLVKYNEELEKQALTDNLTGLANRRRALDYVAQILHEGRFDNFSLCMCDIDFFKRVNDTWGHDTGDIVLKRIAEIFREELKGGLMPCRWGGEEFLLLFPGKNGDEAYEILMDLRDKIKAIVIRISLPSCSTTMAFL